MLHRLARERSQLRIEVKQLQRALRLYTLTCGALAIAGWATVIGVLIWQM